MKKEVKVFLLVFFFVIALLSFVSSYKWRENGTDLMSLDGDGNLNVTGDLRVDGVVVPRTLNRNSDYGEFEAYDFDVMLMNTSDSSKYVTFPNSTYMAYYKDGQRIIIYNIESGDHNVFVDVNGNEVDGSNETRVIRPHGFAIFQKVDDKIRIVDSVGVSVYSQPTHYSNLEFWVDFSNSSSLELSGSVIDNVTDIAGGVLGVTTNNNPTLLEGAQNDLDVAHFDGGNQMINFGDINVYSNLVNRGIHVFMVLRAEANNDAILTKHNQGTSDREFTFHTNSQNLYENNDGSGLEATTGVKGEYGTWNIYEFSWETGEQMKGYVNSFLNDVSSNVVNNMSDTNSDLLIGARNGNSNDFLGMVGEVVVFSDVLDYESRVNLVSSLGAKWGIDTGIPVFYHENHWNEDENLEVLSPVSEGVSLDMNTGNVTGSSGLFSFVGSLVERVSKLFVSEIDSAGNITLSGGVGSNYVKFGGGGYLYDNGSHTIIGHE